MSLPSINQVRHLFVGKAVKGNNETPSDLGDIKVGGVAGKFLYIQHFGHGGLTASDKIDVDKIISAKITKSSVLKSKLTKHKVTVTVAESGQVYAIKLQVNQFIGNGAQDITYRIGTYKAKTGDDAAAIAAGLAASLQLSVTNQNICNISVSGATITIAEVEQEWELGRFPVAHMPLKIFLGSIYTEDEYETTEWATVDAPAGSDSPSAIEYVAADDANKKLADLEYFCMGARGDEYRGVGYPRSINTKYLIDMTATYVVFDIHYFYQGSNEAVQKSEKDLTILVPESVMETLQRQFQAIAPDLTFEVIPENEG